MDITQWAHQYGFEPGKVRKVLKGQLRGTSGEARRIREALGLPIPKVQRAPARPSKYVDQTIRERMNGRSVAAWSKAMGFAHDTVRHVLNGKLTGVSGDARRIRLALGLPVPDPSPRSRYVDPTLFVLMGQRSIVAWAREGGYSDRAVQDVLSGQLTGERGAAAEILSELGLWLPREHEAIYQRSSRTRAPRQTRRSRYITKELAEHMEHLSVVDWANSNGFAPHAVYAVLGGKVLGRWGVARMIRERLGLPVPDWTNAKEQVE